MRLLLVLAGILTVTFAMSCRQKGQNVGASSVKADGDSGLAAGVSPQVEKNRTAAYKSFAQNVRRVTRPQEIDQLLFKLDAEYDKYPIEVKYFAAQMIPLRHFRSMVYKLRPLFQKNFDNDGSGAPPSTNATHNLAVSAVMAAVTSQRIMLPYPNVKAVADYLTYPIQLPKQFDTRQNNPGREAKVVEQYTSTATLQRETLCTEFRADMLKAVDRMSKLDFKEGYVTVDLALGFQNVNAFNHSGNNSYAKDRHVLVGEPERIANMSGLMAAMHSLNVACAYTAEDVTYVFEAMGWVAGMDGATDRGAVMGTPAAYRMNVLKGQPSGYPDSLARRMAYKAKRGTEVLQLIKNPGRLYPEGKQLLRDALSYLKAGTHYAKLAYEKGKARGGSQDMYPILDWRRFSVGERLIELGMSKLLNIAGINEGAITADSETPIPKKLLEFYSETNNKDRKVVFKSLVSNEMVSVNVEAIYLDPPTDVRNLLATNFNSGSRQFFSKQADGSFKLGNWSPFGRGTPPAAPGGNQGVRAGENQIRNYEWNKATQWGGEWNKYISGATVPQAIRILAESPGGQPFAAAMSPFIF